MFFFYVICDLNQYFFYYIIHEYYTRGHRSKKLNRQYIGIDLNPVKMEIE